MKNFTFNTPEELQEKLFAMVVEAEKRARARTLPLEKLGVVVEAVASTPYGIAEGDGGHVANSYSFRDPETTYFRLAWYTQGKQKFVCVSVFRGNAKKVAYGANGYLDIDISPSKWEAFRMVFPWRGKKIEDWLRNKRIAAAIRHLPPPPIEIIEIQEIQPDEDGLVKAEVGPHNYIGTPGGWIFIPYEKGDERRTAWTILARQGFPVPRRKANRVWTEALTAAVALHVLGEV